MKDDHYQSNLLHCTKPFKRQLSIIRKTGAVGALAARKAEIMVRNLIHSFEKESRFAPSLPLTRHGELRIKKCRKYDLGGGYRLITLRRNNTLHILYVGTHDECSRWLEHRRGLSKVSIKTEEIISVYNVQKRQRSHEMPPSSEFEETPNSMLATIGDRELRKIFSGLVQGRLSMKSR